MSESKKLPNIYYPKSPIIITPCAPTPNHTLYLTNFDDKISLRNFVNYVYLFKKSVDIDTLKSSLSKVLVDYYPLAGRFKTSIEDENKLVVNCNGEGVIFSEASMSITVEDLLNFFNVPSKSWENLKCEVESKFILGLPLAIQVTNLCCGGMVLCASINHTMCDAIGTSQFLNAWAQLTKTPSSNLPIIPFHDRLILKNREPPQVNFHYPTIYTNEPSHINSGKNLLKKALTETFVAMSFTFGANEILLLKKQCMTSSIKHITSFEVVAAHTWRSLVKSSNEPLFHSVKLGLTVNFRKKMKIPEGYYGNGFVTACAESTVKELVAANNLDSCVKLVQQAKSSVDEEYVKSMNDLLKDKTLVNDDCLCLVITQWKRLGLEDVDFGEGKPLCLSPLAGYNTKLYCWFLPIISDPKAIRVLLSVPKSIMENFNHHMMDIDNWGKDDYKIFDGEVN